MPVSHEATRDSQVRVIVEGELDIATAPAVTRVVDELAACGAPIVLDLREVTFMDAAGVHMLLDAAPRLRSIVPAKPAGMRALRTLGLVGALPFAAA